MPTNRQVALQCATQIVCEGKWDDANHRSTAAVTLAEWFLQQFLEPAETPDQPSPAAPAQAVSAV